MSDNKKATPRTYLGVALDRCDFAFSSVVSFHGVQVAEVKLKLLNNRSWWFFCSRFGGFFHRWFAMNRSSGNHFSVADLSTMTVSVAIPCGAVSHTADMPLGWLWHWRNHAGHPLPRWHMLIVIPQLRGVGWRVDNGLVRNRLSRSAAVPVVWPVLDIRHAGPAEWVLRGRSPTRSW